MRRPPAPIPALTGALLAGLAVAGCSGDGGDLSEPAPVTSTTVLIAPDATPEVGADAEGVTAAADATDLVETTSSEPSPPGSTAAIVYSEPSLVAIPETGVPGLDSSDRFCSAWSRFGGSWQVLLVGSTFLGDPDRLAEWEIAASTVVGPAYDDLIAGLQEELASEADLVAEGYFGVLDRRLDVAEAALASAGADDAARETLRSAWIDALATRDPSTPDLAFTVPDGLEAIVADAAATVRSQRVEFHVDPSMVVDAVTPLTDAYLETSCPDRGTLTGQEIDPEGG